MNRQQQNIALVFIALYIAAVLFMPLPASMPSIAPVKDFSETTAIIVAQNGVLTTDQDLSTIKLKSLCENAGRTHARLDVDSESGKTFLTRAKQYDPALTPPLLVMWDASASKVVDAVPLPPADKLANYLGITP